jgi:prophage maintenance system killer protein
MVIRKPRNLRQMRHTINLVALRQRPQNRVLFLEINGLNFTAREEDATQTVLGLAAGKLDEPGFAAWLRANVQASA